MGEWWIDDYNRIFNKIDWDAVEAFEEEQRKKLRKEIEAEEQLKRWKAYKLPKMEKQLIANPSYRDNQEYYQVATHSRRADVLEILLKSNVENIVEAVGNNKRASERIAQRARRRAANMAWKREEIEEYGKVGYAATLVLHCVAKCIAIGIVAGILFLIISAIRHWLR